MLKSITQNCTINSVLQIWDDDKNHVDRRESILLNALNRY